MYACHAYADVGGSEAPDLKNYGSADWLRLLIMSPDNTRLYGDCGNTMTAFRNLEGPGSDVTLPEFSQAYPKAKVTQLSDLDRELIIGWLLGSKRVLYGGEPITVVPEGK